MQDATLIFPHQLYPENAVLQQGRPVYLVEEMLFFTQYNFHKQKLVLHRASMKMYQAFLEEKKFEVHYIESSDKNADIRVLVPFLAEKGIETIYYIAVTDVWLQQRIEKKAAACSITVVKFPSPNFINTKDDIDEYFDGTKRYFQTDFYIWQRKKQKLLLQDGKYPEGGKWTYDEQNRLKYPKQKTPPEIIFPTENEYVKEARDYVEKYFSGNYGDLFFEIKGQRVFYPTTFEETRIWLDQFLKTRFEYFGDYQDAMVGREHFLHHSVLTPMLNTGLVSPHEIIHHALELAPAYNVSLHSLEGFLRQVLGWREFIRSVYEREGVQQRTRNYWNFSRKIPPSFWQGTTGILPVDTVIKKLLQTGYAHHIERLMILANFMLLCEFDPDEVYRWFMELFIDSYDWVMVPNVYGMTQFADGGLMATKPYISSSNYIMKMSDFKKGEWNEIWDGLFWRFMHVQRDFFEKNQRLNMLLKIFDKMPKEKRETHLGVAEKFLQSLHHNQQTPQQSLF